MNEKVISTVSGIIYVVTIFFCFAFVVWFFISWFSSEPTCVYQYYEFSDEQVSCSKFYESNCGVSLGDCTNDKVYRCLTNVKLLPITVTEKGACPS